MRDYCISFKGRYAVNFGHPFAHVPGSPGGIDPKYRFMSQDLEEAGYKTHIVGKWHLGGSKLSFHPLRRGFQSFYGLLGGGVNFFTKQVELKDFIIFVFKSLIINPLYVFW